jgi:hypothetical protein
MQRILVSIVAGLAIGTSWCADEEKEFPIKTTGYFIADGGYITGTDDVGLKKWENEPFGDLIAGLRLTASPTSRLRLTINPELKSHNIFPIQPGIATGDIVQRSKYNIYVEEGKLKWLYGASNLTGSSEDYAPYSLELGYMIYKDNPDTHVFGDYLFRSMIYPALPFTKFDYAQANIMGLHGRADFLGGAFQNHLFLLTETRNYPYYDLSLAYSGSYKVGNILEVGAGVDARSLIPARPSRTTPSGGEGVGVGDNTYKFVPYQDSTVIHNAAGQVIKTIWVAHIPGTDSALVTVRDSSGNDEPIRVLASGNGIAGLSRGQLSNKAIGSLTPNDGVGDLYPELQGTNTHYSFAGTIVTARASFNPMGFMGEANPLGNNALKIYAELGVLGWENYPGFYEKRSDRMPIMAGINLPTWNFLDYLSFEVEQFKSRELPTYDKRMFLNVPQPGNHKEEVETLWNEDRRKKDDFKWALAMKKSFRGWAMAAQAGTDHMKLEDQTDAALFDVMSRPSQWYVQVRFIGGIY